MDIQITDILVSFMLLKMKFSEAGLPVDEKAIDDFLHLLLSNEDVSVYKEVRAWIMNIEVIINATLAKQVITKPVQKKSRKPKNIKY
jgi:hypothetical protein